MLTGPDQSLWRRYHNRPPAMPTSASPPSSAGTWPPDRRGRHLRHRFGDRSCRYL